MPEQVNTETIIANSPFGKPLTVERNGIVKKLAVFVGKRGAWENKPYAAPQIETDGTESAPVDDKSFMDSVTFFGKNNLKNFINVIARRFGQDYVEDSIGAEGTATAGIFSLDRFLTYWKELRSSAMKLSELNEAYQLAVSEFTSFTTGELMEAVGTGDTYRIEEAKKKMSSLNATLISLKAEFEERKARRSKEAAAETVTAE